MNGCQLRLKANQTSLWIFEDLHRQGWVDLSKPLGGVEIYETDTRYLASTFI